MSGPNSRNAGRTGPTTNSDATSGGSRLRSVRDYTGTISLVLGGALLVRAYRAGTTGRRALQGLAGVGLLAFGLRQRLSPGKSGVDRAGRAAETSDGGAGSAGTDTASRTAHAVEDATNPRDVTQAPDVETQTEPDEGDIQFTTGGQDEPRSEPQLDEAAGEGDSRQRDAGEETSVDLSKTSMADEPNEAVGPQPDQAEPASSEATEPDPSPTEDASHVQADEPATDVGGEDASGEEGGGETTADRTDEANEEESS